MNPLGVRPLLALLASAAISWGGCAPSAATPEPVIDPQPVPGVPRRPPRQCRSDDECETGRVCESKVWAACDTCDGGQVIRVCQEPQICGDDGHCPEGRTCTWRHCL